MTPIVLIPSYNSGPMLRVTVSEALSAARDVLVVIDGSTDGSDAELEGDGLVVLRRARNGGKGAAVHDGLRHAAHAGFTHALVMDSDGQHPGEDIPTMLAASRADPAAMILGQPRFGPGAPWERVQGHRLANALAARLAPGLGDCLFGFRVYPIADLLAVMAQTRFMRGYDFDAEAAIRLAWRGLRPVHVTVPVRYLRPEHGGVSHFHYVRDNLRLGRMFLRLRRAKRRAARP